MSDNPIDPEMDMTLDIDLVKGSRGLGYWFTGMDDLPKDFFTKYVSEKSFLDLCCGDGRIVDLAMRCGARKYRGIEMDEKFIQSSRMKRYLKQGDFTETIVDHFDVIYYFLGSAEHPPDGKGEPDIIEHLKDFEGTLIVYYRKVPHRLQKFQDNLIKEGFKEIDSIDHIKVYKGGFTDES